jgi:hypothetical protein
VAHIDALLVPKANAAADAYGQMKLIESFLPALRSLDGVRIIDDRAYVLIVFDAAKLEQSSAPAQPLALSARE